VPNFLTDLDLKEVSFVDFPANSGAQVMLFKRDGSPRELWEDYVDEVLSVHNKKLKERQSNPPKNLSSDQVEELQQRKPWSRAQASQEARKTGFGQQLWQMVQQDAQPPLAKGKYMYTSFGDIVTALKGGRIETIEEAEKALDDLVEREVVKSGHATSSQNLKIAKCHDPAWNQYYDLVMRLPATAEEKETIEKQEKASGDAMEEINTLAKRLLASGDAPTIEQATVLVCKRFPELEKRYYEAIR